MDYRRDLGQIRGPEMKFHICYISFFELVTSLIDVTVPVIHIILHADNFLVQNKNRYVIKSWKNY